MCVCDSMDTTDRCQHKEKNSLSYHPKPLIGETCHIQDNPVTNGNAPNYPASLFSLRHSYVVYVFVKRGALSTLWQTCFIEDAL